MKGKEQQQEMVPYETPKVEIIEVEVEKGFAVSYGNNPLNNEDWL